MKFLKEFWIQRQIATASDTLRSDEKAAEVVDMRTDKHRKGRIVVEYISPGGNYPRPRRRILCDAGVPLSSVLGNGYFHEMVYKAVRINPAIPENDERILSLGAYVSPIQGDELSKRTVDRKILRFTSG